MAGEAGGEVLEAQGDLSEREVASLVFLREEEKLARDVYRALDGNGNPFLNIQGSEQRHMDEVKVLLDRYGLPDPVGEDQEGVFQDPELQALYDSLVEEGSRSREAALAVGCKIEELDLKDLEEAQAGVTHDDILEVYEHLKLGSRNHLRAFYGKLTQEGGQYEPVFLEPAAFEAVVEGSHERPGGR
jgi:hypothetical protein